MKEMADRRQDRPRMSGHNSRSRISGRDGPAFQSAVSQYQRERGEEKKEKTLL